MKGEVDRELRRVKEGLTRLGLSPEHADAVLGGRDAGLSEVQDLALVAFDADSVQAQVFASPRPVTIQGASVILRQWDGTLGTRHELGKCSLVPLYAGGGQAVLIARRDDARDIRDALRDDFERRTSGSPCTTAHVPLSARELVKGPSRADGAPIDDASLAKRIGWSPNGGGGFGACMGLLSLALGEARGSASKLFFLSEETAVARCEECAERPRAEKEKCARCLRNREEGKKSKEKWDQARSFDEVLGDATDVAFLKLDGRGIGAELEKLQTIAQYVALSRALKHAFELTTLGDFNVPEDRHQIPIAGGDDLLVIIPASWKATVPGSPADAFSLAAALLERAERAFDRVADTEPFQGNAGPRALGAGAGLVIASGMPASFSFDYAGDLVKSAKDAILKGERSALDFAVLRGGSPLSTSLRELRRRDIIKLDLSDDLTGDVQRTRCPYTLRELRELLQRAALLADAPRSALHALHAAMREPTTGMLAVRYQLARHPVLRRALVGDVPLAKLPPHLGEWVLHELVQHVSNGPRWATAIGDLLDTLPFVTAVPSSEEAER